MAAVLPVGLCMAKRDRALYVLAGTQLLVTLAASAYVAWGVPSLMPELQRYATEVPLLARVAISGWPLLACSWLALAVAVVALLGRGQRRARLRAMGVALTLSAALFVVLVMASVLPLLGP